LVAFIQFSSSSFMKWLTQFAMLGMLMTCLVIESCQHDPFIGPNTLPDPPGSGMCDPDSVYFQNQILPILVSNCTESGCHNLQDRKDGVVLDSYQNLLMTVEEATNNDLQKNKLMRAILDDDPDDRMPPAPNAALSTAQIDLLKKWVSQGALNNTCDENFGGCVPEDAKYSTLIQPLVQTKCLGCHSGNNAQGGVKLSNYSEVKAYALNGKLYSSITRSSSWMPIGGAKLDDCTLQRIQNWILLGAPEN
jgi:hypothetical protein